MHSQPENDFDKQGHRGCRGLMPENSIPAMLKALELGVTTLEMDVVFTRDRLPILSHEPYFNHEISTKPDGSPVEKREELSLNIFSMDYADVVKYDVGMKPHPRFPGQKKIPAYKPLLADMIDSVELFARSMGRALPFYNIETKSSPLTDGIFHPSPGEFIDGIMSVVINKGIEDRVIIQSFDFRTLQYLHKHHPAIKTAMLIEESDKRSLGEQLTVLGFIPSIYSPAHTLVNDALVRECHGKKIKIIPWTVNSREQIVAYQKMGVDGIITDYPDLFH